ncbi:MAG: Fe-S cluster assembly protein SufD [Rudaea sp.]|uniref:Fe-S cluster assembly protein SufD n=1 Tax=unclassified Rudaea TaxID=2627037 RepID=UPI001484D665|nr:MULTISPECIES: Fe-S cluster assembly protein SufD [unclassified Rudaea]MBN8886419.1 Fe-S cluster assembly protein SufD [Rudaea sp.]MBR0346900.1 Fe-S cluster assembly protein SufD [Rudaea sp.]
MSAPLLEEFGRGDAREREESWRYSKTALRALAQQDYAVADARAALPDTLLEQFDWAATRGRRVVVVNGVFSEAHSDISGVGASVTVGESAGNAYSIRIDGDIERPMHVVYANVPSAQSSRWQANVEVTVVSGRARVIEQFIGAQGESVLGSLRRRYDLADATQLDLVSLCELPESVAMYRLVEARVGAKARLHTTHVLLGGRLQRLDFQVDLAGSEARLESRGVFALRGRDHADTQLDVRHLARDTACDVVWRGVADARARGIFRGAITVAQGADGSDAKLSNKNLLLSSSAEIDTQPALEIYADEVKAAHGATVGQIDERALFYLRSRGIPLAVARRMMVTAFCAEALAGIGDADLRELLAQRVQAVLPAE